MKNKVKKLLLKWLDKEVKQYAREYAIEQLKDVQIICMKTLSYPLTSKGRDGAGRIIQKKIKTLET